MVSHDTQEYLHITSETYQEIVHRAVHDRNPYWSQYFLLLNACLENLKDFPPTPEQRDEADVETLLTEALERLATAITVLLPGGINEFRSYLAEAERNYKLPARKEPQRK